MTSVVEATEAHELGEVVERVRSEQPIPGVAVGILSAEEELVAGYGETNVEHPLPVDGDTVFQIGSITKTVLATAIVRLVEQRRLDLDVPVRTYLPSLRLRDEAAASRATLRHLLTHTGGWFGDFFEDTGTSEDALARYVEKLAELEQLTPLGAVWSYSNSGFALAARIVEVVTATTVEAAITELVLAPLGMRRSFFFAADAITHRVAAGHFTIDGRSVVARPWSIPRASNAVGAIASTVRDMFRYARFHLGDGASANGERLLSEAGLRAMRAPLAPGPLDQSMGLAWWVRRTDGVELTSHGGATSGQQALLTLAPERGFALVVLTNSDRGAFAQRSVMRWAFQRYLGISEPAPAPISRPADLAEYVGRYESPGATIDLVQERDRLVFRRESRVTLAKEYEQKPEMTMSGTFAFCGEDRIVVLDGPLAEWQGEFLRDASGRIALLRAGGRVHRRR